MKRVILWWAQHFLWAEFVLAVVVTSAFGAWIWQFGGQRVTDAIIQGNRAAVYGAMASIFGSLLGFAITAESIVLGFSGSDQLAIVRESKHYKTLWRVFISAIRALGLATALSLIGLVFDRDSQPVWPCFILVVFGTVLASLRLLRCIWVLEHVVNLISSPSKERKGGE